MERVVLIGYGAIGRSVLRALADDGSGLTVSAVLDTPDRCLAIRSELGDGIDVIASLDEFPDAATCALECAGHAAVVQHVPALLRRGIDVVLVSVGSLSAPGLAEALEAAAREGSAQLTLIAGAVPGIDALAAARPFGLERVTYIGRKPPLGWRDTPAERVADLASLTAPTTIFEGSAREAARTYPKNANVAATIALAGLGLDATAVRLIADPAVSRNIHSVEAAGSFGELQLTIAGRPLPENPKTSALAAYSALRALRNRVAPLVM